MIEKIGSIKIVTIIAPKPSTDTIRITSFDLPSKTILCPGSIDVAVPSCGTFNNMEGINSISAWATDVETINTHRNSGENCVSNNPDDANKIAPAGLACIPSISPVVAPISIVYKTSNNYFDYIY